MIGFVLALVVAVSACAALLWRLAVAEGEVRRLTNLLVARGEAREFARIQEASADTVKARREPEPDPELVALGLDPSAWQ